MGLSMAKIAVQAAVAKQAEDIRDLGLLKDLLNVCNR
jgi:hypothetical protein